MIVEKSIFSEAKNLLVKLITTPSFSQEEEGTARIIEEFYRERNIPFSRHMNNIWARNKHFDKTLPTILLNSHHDTVKPNVSYTKDPFTAYLEGDCLFGLGSNDAGGPLVAMMSAFEHFYYRSDLRFNLIMASTAEEEISGKNGIESILGKLPIIDLGIVGEPTGLNLAIAEKGLLVLDCLVKGKAGHAARKEGENAIYKAMRDMDWFMNFKFPKVSETLGEMKMSLTVIEAGGQHNVVPDECKFVVDVRITDAYSLEETLAIIKSHVDCQIKPRSVRLNSSSLSKNHPILAAAQKMGIKTYGSPTMSDQALMPFETVKLGPGESSRSHTADEFIKISELNAGIDCYVGLLESFGFGIKN